ncbi:ABC transporter permease [Marinomonas pollencensis]|uniref:Ribose transport system permease protein n=1 Tax=Marinomonas pollencensis TaxID=491954 RepID=A0A3E0DH62_9GAMM|nr:ABC transporter permease [Marinomonas pollencensis]REG81925.1 ribose transport system permease protein [Marinomonas pollencensis]
MAKLEPAPMMTRLRRLNMAAYAPFIALLLLVIFSSIASDTFLMPRNITNVLRQVSYTGIIALGMTFVIIAGGIDLSVGSMVAVVGVLTIMIINGAGDGWWAVAMAVSSAIALGGVFGALNGLIITRGKVASFIATLATMSIFRSMALYISDAGEMVSTNAHFSDIGGGYLWGIPYPVWVFLLLAAVYHILLKHSAFGRHVCAIGSNPKVASYSAIKVRWVYFQTFVIAGASVGIAAVLLTSRLNSISPSDAGIFYELDAIAAVVIGGTALSGGKGTIWGTVIGVIILGIINNMLNLMGISPYLQGMVKGLVILIAVLVQFKGDR